MSDEPSSGTERQNDDLSDLSFDMNPTDLPPARSDTKKDDSDAAAPKNGNGNGTSTPSESAFELEPTDASAESPGTNTATPAAPEAPEADAAPKKKLPIGERLVVAGLIDRDQLNVALYEKQNKPDKMLGELIVDLGFISAEQLSSVLAEDAGFQNFSPKGAIYDPDILEMIPKRDATKFNILPVSLDKEKNQAIVAMVDPYDVVAMDRLRRVLPKGCTIVPQICAQSTLSEAIDSAYGYATSVEGILKELAGEDVSNIDLDDISEDAGYSHPIVRLVNALVMNGVKVGASDLHFNPEENFVRIRYRIDGVLRSTYIIHKEYWNAIAQRLKIMAGMNIADKLMPQDGRFNIDASGREADFRVSCLPTTHGENFVLRVQDKSAGIIPLDALGFSDHNRKLIKRAQSRPEGIIIVTGPTGSGKTTSLYSMLNEANRVDVNIMTLEDPVEYSLPMIRQTNVREGAGLNFGDGVKALLRQDPDIIFVGEVRDEVTAEQALKAAMTGHQVYTSLHTNDSFGAIPRLLDLKLKPGMLAGAIIACFAQRLVRTLCTHCKVEKTATEEECRLLGVDPASPPQIFEKKGCPHCENTGYSGRTAVVEILFMDEDLNNLIAEDAGKSKLKATAKAKGFKSMLDDGILKILEGKTSLEAVMKVVDFTDRI